MRLMLARILSALRTLFGKGYVYDCKWITLPPLDEVSNRLRTASDYDVPEQVISDIIESLRECGEVTGELIMYLVIAAMERYAGNKALNVSQGAMCLYIALSIVDDPRVRDEIEEAYDGARQDHVIYPDPD